MEKYFAALLLTSLSEFSSVRPWPLFNYLFFASKEHFFLRLVMQHLQHDAWVNWEKNETKTGGQ